VAAALVLDGVACTPAAGADREAHTAQLLAALDAGRSCCSTTAATW
jgi:hypothetical protein